MNCKTSRAGRLLALIAAALLLCAACTKAKSSPTNKPTETVKRSVFRWGERFPRYLDPNRVTETPGNYIAQNLWEGLLNQNIGTGPPVPGVATGFTVSADKLSYTFTLRKSAKWSNGRGVTAHDFAYSWRRALNPTFISENAELIWQFVAGAKLYKDGELLRVLTALSRCFAGDLFAKADDTVWRFVGVTVIDDYTLRVSVRSPTPFFPYLVAYIAYAPVPKEAIARWGNKWTLPEHIVVNGPYKLTLHKHRTLIVLEKNPRYWDARSVRIPRVEFHHTERATQAMKMYNLGQIDYMTDLVPTDVIPKLKQQGRKDFYIDPLMCTYYIKFNNKRKPFTDVRVRQAFDRAINKDELVTNLLQGGQIPATNLLPLMFDKTHGYRSPKGASFDPTKAKKLLSDAGYTAANFPEVTLLFNADEMHEKVAAFYQESVRKHLGIKIGIQKMEWKSLLAKLHQRDFTLARTAWCADYPDPLAFLLQFHSQSENNDAQYKKPEFDKLLDQIRAATERKERNQLMTDAEKMLIADLPYMPLFHYSRAYMLKPYVGGYREHVMDYHLLKYLYFR